MNIINKCNICGNTIDVCDRGYTAYFKDSVGLNSDYEQKILLCKNCGFIFVQNPLSEEMLNIRYKNFSKYEFDKKQVVLRDSEEYKRRSNRQKNFIENSLFNEKYDSVLEIGAATGFNLSLYKDSHTVFGIEPSEANCQNAKSNYGIDMYSGVFSEYIRNFPDKKYDLIFLSHTLEHIVNPFDFIKQCEMINNKYMFIEVPTLDYKFNDEPYGMFTDEHVNIFTFEALQNIMTKNGYSLVNAEIPFYTDQPFPSGCPAICTLWKKTDSIMKWIPTLKAETILREYLKSSEKNMQIIREKIDSISNDSKVALWGIGNTASRILGDSSLLKKNIVRCYDSDIKKHGVKFANVEISSFDAKDIEDNIIDTVVITTYTAQKIISKILEPYGKKLNVVKLFNIC